MYEDTKDFIDKILNTGRNVYDQCGLVPDRQSDPIATVASSEGSIWDKAARYAPDTLRPMKDHFASGKITLTRQECKTTVRPCHSGNIGVSDLGNRSQGGMG